MACIHYRSKQIRLLHCAMLAGDIETDLVRFREAYRACRGFKPEFGSFIDLTIAEQYEHHAKPHKA